MNLRGLSLLSSALFLNMGGWVGLFAGRPLDERSAAATPTAPILRPTAPTLLPLTGLPQGNLSDMVPETLPRMSQEAGNTDIDALFGTAGAEFQRSGGPSPGDLQGLLHSATPLPSSPASLLAPPPAAAPARRAPPTPEQAKLLAVARKVAPAVVFLRAWDASGNELASGCGFFLDDRGMILTDIQVVHPEFAAQIEYITAGTGAGTFHRITGFWMQDPKTGLTMLQSDATETPFLLLQPGADFSQEQLVSIVALQAERGLSLADAFVKADTTKAGDGWLNLHGEDSPGEPGSPVIDAEGRVVAVVSMRVPQGKWFNFGLRVDSVVEVMKQFAVGAPRPLSRLARGSEQPVTQDPRFLAAFRALYERQIVRGTSQLLLLLRSYPRSAEVWALLGLAYAQLGAREEALNCSRKAVALDPRIGQFWRQLALSHLSTAGGQPSLEALESLERTVDQQPADKMAWLLLAEQQLLAQQYAGAERALVEVVKLEPDYAPASFLLGYAKARQGDQPAAEAALLRCLKLDRKHARAWFYLALLYARQQRLPDAARAYRQLVAIQPAHPHAWRNLALIERRLGHDTASQQALERHLKIGAPAL